MAKRSAPNQSRHDKGVRRLADRMSSAGYKVSADALGYPRPAAVRGGRGRGRRPDIVATRGGARRVIEAETDDSYDRDRGQRKVFWDYAGRAQECQLSHGEGIGVPRARVIMD